MYLALAVFFVSVILYGRALKALLSGLIIELHDSIATAMRTLDNWFGLQAKYWALNFLISTFFG